MKTCKCIVCGREFETERHNQTICSSECRKEREKQLRKAKAGPRRRRKTDVLAANRVTLRTMAEERARRQEAREAYLAERDRQYAASAADVPRRMRIAADGTVWEMRGNSAALHY